jgi:hypothetical protein
LIHHVSIGEEGSYRGLSLFIATKELQHASFLDHPLAASGSAAI